MCYGCYEALGCPKIDSPAVREAVLLMDRVLGFHPSGGHLHIVLDDWNLEDYHLESCERWLAEEEHETPPEEVKAERACLEVLKALSVAERASALAISDGCWTP